ncbi:MAG: hypothetical protein M1826_002097 [Phylliscum demangeonii]|nr:MAG: hypothetical protein M1826_002097 [Phylliscum demangeonii]
MEKYSQFRDRGSGIAPFFPVPSRSSRTYFFVHVFLFSIRLPIFLTVVLGYFLVLRWAPLGFVIHKALLGLILGIPGIWWVDLQIDGVRKGSLARHHAHRLPQPSDIIASSFTSPVDAIYLAAIFDPIFTASYPDTRQVRKVTLLSAVLRAFRVPLDRPPAAAKTTDLRTLIEANPGRVVVVFPETTTTNGTGVLIFSPSLLGAAPGARIFPISLRYAPGNITTPVPGSYWAFLWSLLSEPTHTVRVRIAECVYNVPSQQTSRLASADKSYTSNFLDTLQAEETASQSSNETRSISEGGRASEEPSAEELPVLDKVAKALARLGRVNRVGLGTKDKIAFVASWKRRQGRRQR